MENEELSQLFAEAMEATEKRAEQAKRTRVDEDDSVGAPLTDDVEELDIEDFDIDMEIDATSADIKLDFLPGNLILASDEDDDEESDTANDAETGTDTSAQIDQLLSRSFGAPISDDDPDLAFPDFGDEDDDEDGIPDAAFEALSGSTATTTALADAEQREASLRRQLNQMSRTLADRELELETAQERVKTLEAQVVETARKSVHTGREFDSFRRRAERDQQETKKFAVEKLLKDFITVLDNLERALEHAGEQKDTALGKGVAMTLEQFLAVLDKAGAHRVAPAEAEPFDPTYHEAMGQEQHETVPVSHVIRTVQKGLVLNERLVRAAMVIVSSGNGEEAEAAPPPAAEGQKKRKRKRKRKKVSAEAATDEAGVAAAEDGEAPAPKKRRRKRKRKKRKVEAGDASEGSEQTTSADDDDS